MPSSVSATGSRSCKASPRRQPERQLSLARFNVRSVLVNRFRRARYNDRRNKRRRRALLSHYARDQYRHRFYLADKNYAEAVNQFKLARNRQGTTYDLLSNLGRAYRQYAVAVKDIDKKLSTDNLKYAAEQFEEAIRLKGDALDAYFQLGLCYRELHLYPQATSAFKKALALAPQDFGSYYQLGLIAMDQGYYREAEAYFQDGLRINPDHVLILLALGRLYIETKQYQAAISTLRQATQTDGLQWESWYELGRAHMRAKEWKLALSALERGRQANADVPDIYSAMATSYLKLNKKVEARQMVNEALSRDAKNAEALRLKKQL